MYWAGNSNSRPGIRPVGTFRLEQFGSSAVLTESGVDRPNTMHTAKAA